MFTFRNMTSHSQAKRDQLCVGIRVREKNVGQSGKAVG